MTALNRNPTNTNLLQPTKFLLNFSKIDSVQYFCQGINLPGITLSGPAQQSTPFQSIPKTGDVLTYNPLSVTFTVDEDLKTIQAYKTGLKVLQTHQDLLIEIKTTKIIILMLFLPFLLV